MTTSGNAHLLGMITRASEFPEDTGEFLFMLSTSRNPVYHDDDDDDDGIY